MRGMGGILVVSMEIKIKRIIVLMVSKRILEWRNENSIQIS